MCGAGLFLQKEKGEPDTQCFAHALNFLGIRIFSVHFCVTMTSQVDCVSHQHTYVQCSSMYYGPSMLESLTYSRRLVAQLSLWSLNNKCIRYSYKRKDVFLWLPTGFGM